MGDIELPFVFAEYDHVEGDDNAVFVVYRAETMHWWDDEAFPAVERLARFTVNTAMLPVWVQLQQRFSVHYYDGEEPLTDLARSEVAFRREGVDDIDAYQNKRIVLERDTEKESFLEERMP